LSEIQWQATSCKTPFLVVIVLGGENHQVASCGNSMNTLTLSINGINNHNDNIDFQYFAEKRSLPPPVSEIQCWQTSSCETPFLAVIL
jgi:hypothetical protein